MTNSVLRYLKSYGPELALSGYVALIGLVASRHEMWKDEVHAWSIATASTSWGAMLRELHLEGHPPLWYALLRLGYAVTGSQLVLPVVSAVIGVIMVWLVLWKAPFPFYIRALFAFGIVPAYEYSVMCRSYGLGALLILAWAHGWRAHRNSIWPAVLLALAALTSLHAAVAAAALTFLIVSDWTAQRQAAPPTTGQHGRQIMLVWLGIILSVATLWPDASTVGSAARNSTLSETLQRAIDQLPRYPSGIPDFLFVFSDIWGTKWFGASMPWSPGVLNSLVVAANLLAAVFLLRFSHAGLFTFAMLHTLFFVIFFALFPGYLRHEGLLLCGLLAIAWVLTPQVERGTPSKTFNSLLLGAILGWQFILAGAPIVLDLRAARSGAETLASALRSRNVTAPTILAELPNMSDALPYYLPESKNFQVRTGEWRQWHRYVRVRNSISLGEMMDSACAIGERTNSDVVLIFSDTLFASTDSARVTRDLGDLVFSWTPSERQRLRASFESLGYFAAFTDERLTAQLLSRKSPRCFDH